MDDAKNVLLVTNSATEEEILLVKNAFMDAAKQGWRIKLSLVHVIPSLPSCYFNIPSMAQLAEQYYTEAKNTLNNAAGELGIAKRDQWLITGRIKTEVLRLANKLGIQFVLASSTSIHDLRKALSFNTECKPEQIQNIQTLVSSQF